MQNTRKSTTHAPQSRQAAIPTRGHANNANNFSYEKTPLRYNLVRTPNLAAQPATRQPPSQLQLRPVAVTNCKLHRYATGRTGSDFSYETKNRPSLWRTSQSWSVAGQASIQCQSHAPGMPPECTGSATGVHPECHGSVTGTLCQSASSAPKQPSPLTPSFPLVLLPSLPYSTPTILIQEKRDYRGSTQRHRRHHEAGRGRVPLLLPQQPHHRRRRRGRDSPRRRPHGALRRQHGRRLHPHPQRPPHRRPHRPSRPRHRERLRRHRPSLCRLHPHLRHPRPRRHQQARHPLRLLRQGQLPPRHQVGRANQLPHPRLRDDAPRLHRNSAPAVPPPSCSRYPEMWPSPRSTIPSTTLPSAPSAALATPATLLTLPGPS